MGTNSIMPEYRPIPKMDIKYNLKIGKDAKVEEPKKPESKSDKVANFPETKIEPEKYLMHANNNSEHIGEEIKAQKSSINISEADPKTQILDAFKDNKSSKITISMFSFGNTRRSQGDFMIIGTVEVDSKKFSFKLSVDGGGAKLSLTDEASTKKYEFDLDQNDTSEFWNKTTRPLPKLKNLWNAIVEKVSQDKERPGRVEEVKRFLGPKVN